MTAHFIPPTGSMKMVRRDLSEALRLETLLGGSGGLSDNGKENGNYYVIWDLGFGSGDLVSGLVMGISRVIIWVIEAINLLTKSSRPSR